MPTHGLYAHRGHCPPLWLTRALVRCLISRDWRVIGTQRTTDDGIILKATRLRLTRRPVLCALVGITVAAILIGSKALLGTIGAHLGLSGADASFLGWAVPVLLLIGVGWPTMRVLSSPAWDAGLGFDCASPGGQAVELLLENRRLTGVPAPNANPGARQGAGPVDLREGIIVAHLIRSCMPMARAAATKDLHMGRLTPEAQVRMHPTIGAQHARRALDAAAAVNIAARAHHDQASARARDTNT